MKVLMVSVLGASVLVLGVLGAAALADAKPAGLRARAPLMVPLSATAECEAAVEAMPLRRQLQLVALTERIGDRDPTDTEALDLIRLLPDGCDRLLQEEVAKAEKAE